MTIAILPPSLSPFPFLSLHPSIPLHSSLTPSIYIHSSPPPFFLPLCYLSLTIPPYHSKLLFSHSQRNFFSSLGFTNSSLIICEIRCHIQIKNPVNTTLAYFLRWTNVFPMRRSNFSCLDPELSHSAKESPFLDFAFQAEVSDEAIYSLSVCVPPFVILISEIGMWAFGTEPQRSISILCGACRVPQIIRRIFRFIGKPFV
ncbi:unnamed protein product [Acanthosepion pharaonis]|uniref:Uncharacterized protein n=1 Tax=Acanthosepion pharaonis TaxID=158019 RepID=A0A812DMX9_ACAPH|nr:unnamed protein product [Sepia pharaonis]